MDTTGGDTLAAVVTECDVPCLVWCEKYDRCFTSKFDACLWYSTCAMCLDVLRGVARREYEDVVFLVK